MNNSSDNLPQVQSQLESTKLLFDLFKHLTTLATGSILLLVGFLEKLFTTPKWKILIALSFISFIVAIVSSVIAMIMLSATINRYRDEEVDTFARSAQITMISFAIGILSLVVFALRNFYS